MIKTTYNKMLTSALAGGYFCKIDIIDEGNITIYKWDIGIDESNIKSGIIEKESNGNYLEKFKNTINEISQKRFEVFLMTLHEFPAAKIFSRISFITTLPATIVVLLLII